MRAGSTSNDWVVVTILGGGRLRMQASSPSEQEQANRSETGRCDRQDGETGLYRGATKCRPQLPHRSREDCTVGRNVIGPKGCAGEKRQAECTPRRRTSTYGAAAQLRTAIPMETKRSWMGGRIGRRN